jgi:hypothetical protein
MKKKVNFIPTNYKLMRGDDYSKLTIEGQKMPPPSKRITLHQANIKILGAKIIYKQKGKEVEFELSRINYIKSFGELRLHTNSTLYPGNYILLVEFSGDLDESLLGEKIS